MTRSEIAHSVGPYRYQNPSIGLPSDLARFARLFSAAHDHDEHQSSLSLKLCH
jgi:hypothetical protein